jgi:hypothetical protein
LSREASSDGKSEAPYNNIAKLLPSTRSKTESFASSVIPACRLPAGRQCRQGRQAGPGSKLAQLPTFHPYKSLLAKLILKYFVAQVVIIANT